MRTSTTASASAAFRKAIGEPAKRVTSLRLYPHLVTAMSMLIDESKISLIPMINLPTH